MLDHLIGLRNTNASLSATAPYHRCRCVCRRPAGSTVEVTLTPRGGSVSLAACSEAERAAVGRQRCTIKSGDLAAAAACQLQLPCTGEFLLKGCITGGGISGISSNNRGSSNSSNSNSGGSCSRPIVLGRNLTTWAAAPWSSGPGQFNLLADKSNVTEGSDVTLVVQNPYWGPTSGLLVWGQGELREQRVLPEVRSSHPFLHFGWRAKACSLHLQSLSYFAGQLVQSHSWCQHSVDLVGLECCVWPAYAGCKHVLHCQVAAGVCSICPTIHVIPRADTEVPCGWYATSPSSPVPLLLLLSPLPLSAADPAWCGVCQDVGSGPRVPHRL